MLVVLFVGRVCSWVCSCGGPLSCGAVCRCVLGTEAVIFLLRRHSGSCSGPCPSPFCRLKHSVQAMLSSFLAFAEFGTGEGLLRYGICAPCKKQAPGVRDAFSEAFGVKNRRFRYRMDIRYRKPPSLVRAMCANIRKYPGIGTAIEWGGETWVLTKKISGVLDYYRVISYLCRMELRYGVMVALQILVLPAQVRILVPQRFLEK